MLTGVEPRSVGPDFGHVERFLSADWALAGQTTLLHREIHASLISRSLTLQPSFPPTQHPWLGSCDCSSVVSLLPRLGKPLEEEGEKQRQETVSKQDLSHPTDPSVKGHHLDSDPYLQHFVIKQRSKQR